MDLPLNVEVCSADQPATPGAIGTSRVGVLVLGMHRSGTSAMARMLSMLGCSLPATVLGANDTNPTGHWESEVVLRFNDELLAQAGSSWDDWMPVGEGFFAAPGYPELVARGAQLLRSEFGGAPLFVFKDPRNCRLARFWLDVFAAEAISPAIVMPIRNPLEVARSLATRDRADEHYGPLLWLRHVLDAEAATRGKARAFTSYDQLLECWEVVAARLQAGLGIAWPRMSPATQEEIGDFIDKRHRHEIGAAEAILSNPLLSGWVRRTFAILQTWLADGENAADHAELDAIMHAFNEAAPAFARLILHGKQARYRADELEAQLAPLQATIARAAELEAALGQAHSRAVQLEADAAQQLASQHALLSQDVAQARAEQDVLHRKVDELTSAGDAARRQALALEAKAAELQWLLGEAQAKVDAGAALRGQIDELTGWREAAEGKLAALEHRNAELQWLLGEAQAKIAALSALQGQIDELAGARDAAEARASAADERLHRANYCIEEQEHRIAANESALVQRREENEQVWAALAQEQSASADLRRELGESRQREEAQQQRLMAAEQSQASAQADAEQRIEAMAARLQDALASNADIEARLADRFEEVARLSQMLHEADLQASAAQANAMDRDAVEAANREMDVRLQALLAERTAAEGRLRERFDEVALLTTMVSEQQLETARQHCRVEWLRQLGAALATRPRWWALMPRGWQRRRDSQRLKKRGLFDGDAYLTAHPDVSLDGMEPLRHYLLHGYAEGRLPMSAQMLADEAGAGHG